MNTRFLLPAALVAAALTLTAPAAGMAFGFAVLHPAGADGQRNDQGQPFSLNGRIQSVDYTSNVIVVRAKGQQAVSIALTPTTAVDAGGQVGSIADLRPGVHVHVRGSVRNGVMVAESIVIK